MRQKETCMNNDSTILYGVPKVEWGTYGGATPYPICLKACADYLGDDLDYASVMVASGGAFRFTWNENDWDMSNVDIFHTSREDGEDNIYAYAAKALGREFSMIDRTESTTKEEFVHFIKKHIDEGFPCIAQGIIGPPEACIITGYREHGNVLLGWNFFQNDPAFGGNVTIDESGYFVCDNWWENADTQSVMCLGPVEREAYGCREIIKKAVTVMNPRKDGAYCKGVAGFFAWRRMLCEDSAFTGENQPLLFEKMLCQDDATTCLIDGRGSAAEYFRRLVEDEKGEVDDVVLEKYKTLANIFEKEKNVAEQTWALLGDWEHMEQRPEKLSEKSVREQACKYTEEIEALEMQSLEILKGLL